MSKKIQFINSYGKFHEYNFIRVALPNDEVVVYSDTGYAKPESEEIAQYYKAHNISVVKANPFSEIKIGVLRRFLNLCSAIIITVGSRNKKYEYCFIHYLSTRRAILSMFIPKKTKQVLITYGSDILRRKDFNEFFFRKMLEKSHLIVFNSGNLRYKFEEELGKKYADKCVDIAFPCASFKRLEQNLIKYPKKYSLNELGLPDNKTIVVCGHTSTHDERHEKLIDALNKVPESYLNKCCFVFPMTYGNGDYLQYREKIKTKLKNAKFKSIVFEEYMPFDRMCMLHSASDVHITGITTDALSLFLLEEMYSGSHLIYGEWLHYIEFEENSLGCDSYKDFSDLPELFVKVLDGRGTPAPDNQKDIIERLQSNETIQRKWEQLLAE